LKQDAQVCQRALGVDTERVHVLGAIFPYTTAVFPQGQNGVADGDTIVHGALMVQKKEGREAASRAHQCQVQLWAGEKRRFDGRPGETRGGRVQHGQQSFVDVCGVGPIRTEHRIAQSPEHLDGSLPLLFLRIKAFPSSEAGYCFL
jgi:hypothetical protein